MTIARILDANFNRAREALRVMEDAARFTLNRRDLAEPIKALRHDLSSAMKTVANLVDQRDTPGDVGTTIQTAQEASRSSIADTTTAAGKRLSEAVRSLEEFSKTLGESHPALPGTLERIRYRGYEIERKLNASMSPYQVAQWQCCVLITRRLCKLPWQEVVDQSIDAGCDCIQIREKDCDAGDFLSHANEVVEHIDNRVTVIVNDRVDIAMACGAHGVHVGQTDMPVGAIRKLCGRQLMVGLSTHKLPDAEAARAAGADYCGIGPMFPSTTKHRDFIAGSDYLKAYTSWDQLPHLAIGGISPKNIGALIPHGLKGVAVSQVVCGADNPSKVTRQLIDAFTSAA